MKKILFILAMFMPGVAFCQQLGGFVQVGGGGISKLDSFVTVSPAIGIDTTPTYVLSAEDGPLKRIPVEDADIGGLYVSNVADSVNIKRYYLTTSYAKCTNVKADTLGTAGTYLIMASAAMRYDSSTFLRPREGSIIVKRTNYGVAQISPIYSGRILFPKELVATSGQAGFVTVPFLYTAEYDGEIIEMWAKIERLPNNYGAGPKGEVTLYFGELAAIKLYP